MTTEFGNNFRTSSQSDFEGLYDDPIFLGSPRGVATLVRDDIENMEGHAYNLITYARAGDAFGIERKIADIRNLTARILDRLSALQNAVLPGWEERQAFYIDFGNDSQAFLSPLLTILRIYAGEQFYVPNCDFAFHAPVKSTDDIEARLAHLDIQWSLGTRFAPPSIDEKIISESCATGGGLMEETLQDPGDLRSADGDPYRHTLHAPDNETPGLIHSRSPLVGGVGELPEGDWYRGLDPLLGWSG
jgi:hypothetical protein